MLSQFYVETAGITLLCIQVGQQHCWDVSGGLQNKQSYFAMTECKYSTLLFYLYGTWHGTADDALSQF